MSTFDIIAFGLAAVVTPAKLVPVALAEGVGTTIAGVIMLRATNNLRFGRKNFPTILQR
jgi:hypothetical protein